MAINKKLIHFKNFSDFNSKKLSANENNTQYTLGIEGAVTNGSPDILYQSICYIKDTKQQWTHGQLYDGSKSDTSNFATKTELAQKQDIISDIDTIRSNAANYKGTVTGVKINGFTKSPSSSGTVDIGSVATSVKINGQSKSPSSGVVDLGYINKQLSTSTLSSMSLSPNIYYRNINLSLSSLTITLGSVSNSNILNEYFVEFTTSSSGTTVSLPSKVKWVNGSAPTFDPGCTYQVSIVNNLGTYIKFA